MTDRARSALTHELGFIGLGVMGTAMASNLLSSGRPLLVWNRTSASSERLQRLGPDVAASPAEVVARASATFLMLSDERATEDVLFEGSIDFTNRTIVQMSTVAPRYSATTAARIREAGGHYVEAPVSGSRQPAIDGRLVAMVAGDDPDIDRVLPHLESLCSAVFRCGAPPDALVMKLAVNTVLITLVTGLAEAFHFAEQHRLDRTLLERILAAGPMSSAVSRAKAQKLTQSDWSVHASIPDVLKNSRLVVDEARRAGSAAPLMNVCTELYAETERLGHTSEDMAAVISAIRQRSQETEHRLGGLGRTQGEG